MNTALAFVAAVSLAIQPLALEDFGPERCGDDSRPMDPVEFSRMTGIIVRPNSMIRIDLDDDCVTSASDVLRWLEGGDAERFIDRRDTRLVTLGNVFDSEDLVWEDAVVGDVNSDDVVDLADLVALAQRLGEHTAHAKSPAFDPNVDGVIDIHDLAMLLDRWGDRSEDDLVCRRLSYVCLTPFSGNN